MACGTWSIESAPQDSRDSKASFFDRRTLLRRLLMGLFSLGPLGAARVPSAMAATDSASVTASGLIVAGDPVYGNPHGTVTIVDFNDIRCPPCRMMNQRVQTLLKTDHSLRYVPIDYPILGPASELGVKAIFAAAMQGKYEALRAILMHQKRKPDMAVLEQNAKRAGLDLPQFALDMNGDRVAARVQRNLSRGRALAIHGIPTLFVGAKRITGGLTYDDLRSVVEQAKKSADNTNDI